MNLQYGDHAGHLYYGFDERIAGAVAFFKEGLARGDQCIWFMEAAARERLQAEITAALKPRRDSSLSIRTDWYGSEDDPHAEELRLDELRSQALAEGFRGLRLLVDTGWAHQTDAVPLTIREGLGGRWCARQRDAIAVCEYDMRAAAPETVLIALRTHSHIVLEGLVVPNPYCEPAELTLEAESPGRRVQWMLERLRIVAENARVRREREERALFLAEACMVLGSSLDLVTKLNQVAKLAVPTVCDLCVVDVLNEDGEARREAVASRNPKLVEAVYEQYRRDWAKPGSFPVLKQVLTSGQAKLAHEVTPEFQAKVWSRIDNKGTGGFVPWRSYMMLPLMVRGEVRGVISFHINETARRYKQSDLTFAESLARAAALALDNARLYRKAQQTAASRERFQIAGELHDTLSQSLFLAGLKTDWCLQRMTRRSRARPKLEEIRADLGRMMEQVRRLLSQTTLEQRSAPPLAARIRTLVEQVGELTGAAVTVEVKDDVEALTPARQAILHRALREALTNVAKHASASRITIDVRRNGGEITFEVIDNGVGLPGPAARADLPGRPSQLGLRLMATELAQEGGRLEVVSLKGGGLRLAGALPLDAPQSRQT